MKWIVTSLLLFISINTYSQEDRIDTFTYTNFKTEKVDTIRVDKKLTPMFIEFIKWADLVEYDYSSRLSDIEGIYYNTLSDPNNVGQTFLFKDKKDYVIINVDVKLREVIKIVVFHELFHLFANTGQDDHCKDMNCSSIMFPFIDGYITYTLSNWDREVIKLFAKLKSTNNEKETDYVTKCKIFSTR